MKPRTIKAVGGVKSHHNGPSGGDGGPAWQNPVKEQLRRGKPVIGIVISVNNVEIAAHAATLGFDFLWIEMEHAPITLDTLRNMVLATRGLPAVPFARPPVTVARAV